MQMLFVVDPRSKSSILQSASRKFRTFKTYLTQKYVNPLKDEPERLATPPSKYSHIEQKDWETFVSSRLTSEWEVNKL